MTRPSRGKTSVLVQGVGSHNGGAELLLLATARALGSWDARAVADLRRVDRRIRRAWRVGSYLSVPRLGALESLGLNALPARAVSGLGLASSATVSAVLDASGFAYGDRWSPRSVALTADIARGWQRNGTPLVFLPQAFGPFEKPAMADAAARLFESATLIFARDDVSLGHLRGLLGADDPRLRKAPDITIALDAGPVAERDLDRIAIVPNINLAGVGRMRFEEYVDALVDTYGLAEAQGWAPQFLVHSSQGDPDVLEAALARRADLRYITPPDGYAAKRAIAQCGGVIGGRFHALVSALSCGVPVAAHSWSHKYGELLADFGGIAQLSDPFDPKASVENLATMMADPATPLTLASAHRMLAEQIEAMWDEVRAQVGVV